MLTKGAPPAAPVEVDADARPRVGRVAFLCFLLILAYAILRYHFFGDVAWIHLPLYTVNKAVSFTALALLALAYLSKTSQARAKQLGLTGFFLAGLHVVMSLALAGEQTYPKLYIGGRWNLDGELSMLAGSLAGFGFLFPALASLPDAGTALGPGRRLRWQRAGYFGVALSLLHVAAMGLRGWFEPDTWPGGLPPITLLSALVAAVPLAVGLRRR